MIRRYGQLSPTDLMPLSLEGRPLSEIGIAPDFVCIRDADGTQRPFDGVTVRNDKTILDALQRKARAENVTIVFNWPERMAGDPS